MELSKNPKCIYKEVDNVVDLFELVILFWAHKILVAKTIICCPVTPIRLHDNAVLANPNKPLNNDDNYIKNCISNQINFLDKNDILKVNYDTEKLPNYVKNNLEKFEEWIIKK